MPDPIIINPGAIDYVPRPTDFQWSDLGAGTVQSVDWNLGYDIEKVLGQTLGTPSGIFKLPIKNQNGSGSCGGQATSNEEGVLEAVSTKSFEERSAKYIIAQTFVLNAQKVMLGSTMGDNGNLVVKQGVAREIVCPSYNNGLAPTDEFMNRPQDITEAARADAKFAKAKSYAYVNATIDEFAHAIANNFGLVMLIRGSNNGTWYTPFPQPGTDEWGHFMYCGKFKMINGKKYIGAFQTWGPTAGEQGWQWFGEEWFVSGLIKIGQTFIFDDTIPPPPHYTFTRDLTLNSTGIDVKFLQVFLNTHGFVITQSGDGSPGHETSFFGKLTQQALSKFQKANSISPALGYFGSITRAKVNSLQ